MFNTYVSNSLTIVPERWGRYIVRYLKPFLQNLHTKSELFVFFSNFNEKLANSCVGLSSETSVVGGAAGGGGGERGGREGGGEGRRGEANTQSHTETERWLRRQGQRLFLGSSPSTTKSLSKEKKRRRATCMISSSTCAHSEEW